MNKRSHPFILLLIATCVNLYKASFEVTHRLRKMHVSLTSNLYTNASFIKIAVVQAVV